MRKKIQSDVERQAEIECARIFGQHVSQQKGIVLLAVTLAACMLPALLGIRLWDRIPETVRTGLIGTNGEDDSLPRAAVVFALPGLMCLLNLITHVQLLVNQRRMTLPRAHIRLMGRWGFPALSLLLCGSLILWSAGEQTSLLYVTFSALGLALMLLGSHLWERSRGIGLFLLAAGLLAAAGAVLMGGLAPL